MHKHIAFARFLNPWLAVHHDPDDQGGTSAGGNGDPGGFDGTGDPGVHDDGGDAGDEIEDLDGGRRGATDDEDEPLANLLIDEEEEEVDEQGNPKPDNRTEAQRIKALEKKNRKLKRALAKRGPVADQVRSAGFRDHNELIESARTFQAIRQAVQSGSQEEVLRLLGISSDGKHTRSTPGRTSASNSTLDLEDVEFDESVDALGFDPKQNKANEVIAKGLREVAQLKKAFQRLVGDRQQDQQNLARQRDQQLYTQWNEATKAAATQIKHPGHRKAFIDLIKGAFLLNRGKVQPQAVIAHYLKQLGVDARDAKNANLKARGAMVNRNRQQSRFQAPNGRPGDASKHEKPSLKAVKQKILSLGNGS